MGVASGDMLNMEDDLNQTVAAELRSAAARRNLSGAQLARNSGLPGMYVHRRLNGTATISVEDLIELSRGIGVEPLDMFAQILTTLEIEPANA